MTTAANLMPLSLSIPSMAWPEVVGFTIEKGVLDRSPNELSELSAHDDLLECSDGIGRSSASWLIKSKQFNHTDGRRPVFWCPDYAAVKVREELYVTRASQQTRFIIRPVTLSKESYVCLDYSSR
jgi:hypothetical protein